MILWDAVTNEISVHGKTSNECILEAGQQSIDLPWFNRFLLDDINHRVCEHRTLKNIDDGIEQYLVYDYPFTHQTRRPSTYGKNLKNVKNGR